MGRGAHPIGRGPRVVCGVLECRIMQVDKKADPWKQVRVGIYVTDNRKQKKAE